jgi:hypothetical protein
VTGGVRRAAILAALCTVAVPSVVSSAANAATPGRAGRAGGTVANTWVPTAAPMSVARSGQTATLLPDGQVLVAGGATATAELYDPATRTFAPTGSMSVARPGATATRLPDGDVLVAGGCCEHANRNLASAELYDPGTRVWTTTGSMHFPRSGHTATLLPDGRVLVDGGACNGVAYGCDFSSFYAAQRSAEIYDPTTGAWSDTGRMQVGREFQTATRLRDGTVLVAGGFTSCDDDFCSDLAKSELYDPASGKWTATGSMHSAREQHTATLLPGGLVLVSGGLNEGGYRNGGRTEASAELYDPSTGTWSSTASMDSARYGHTATLLKNGWVLVSGGQTDGAEIYEPPARTWVSPGAMGTARTDHTATLLGDGRVLVTGGVGPDGRPQPTAEVFLAGRGPLVSIAPTSLTFATKLVGTTSGPHTYRVENLGTSPLAVSGIVVSGAHPSDFGASTDCTAGPLLPGASCTVSTTFAPTATGLRTAIVAVADNAPHGPHGATVAGYGSGPDAWAPTAPMSSARDNATATLLRNGHVLIAGGQNGPASSPLSQAELYDPATHAFTTTGSLQTGRANATATLLADGDVLVAGGKGANFANLTSAELYNPATGTWSTTGAMNDFGYALTSTLLPNGKVLVVGLGFGATAEVYDPASGAWTDTGPMAASHFFATANLLNTGQVLVAGGGNATAERYDPMTNAWTATGSMHAARSRHTATRLANGQVLVAGGDPPGGGVSLAGAELYDPSTGSWTLTDSMNTGRSGHAATLLTDGLVMVTGGCTASCGRGQVVATTEFYSPGDGYWLSAPAMIAPRYEHTATLLATGDLLVAGGDSIECCTATTTAEVYTPTILRAAPDHGAAGQGITLSGRGFYAGEPVKVTWDFGQVLARPTTSSRGAFVINVTVPSNAPAGTHSLAVTGQHSFAGAQIPFTVP